jgi:hypothetical protein
VQQNFQAEPDRTHRVWAGKLEEVCKFNAKVEAEDAIKIGSVGKKIIHPKFLQWPMVFTV